MNIEVKEKSSATLTINRSVLTLHKQYSKKKEIWDVMNGFYANSTIAILTKKKEKDNTITSKIIKPELTVIFTSTLLEKKSSEILKDSLQNLLISWPRNSVFYIQKTAKLFQSCEAS